MGSNKKIASLAMLLVLCLILFFCVANARKQDQIKENKKIYNAGFSAGKAEAEKAAADEKKGRIYRVLEIKTPKNLSKKGEISWITVIGANVEKRDFVTQQVESSFVYDKTDARFLKQFESAKFVVIGEDGELIPLSSYIPPERIGG